MGGPQANERLPKSFRSEGARKRRSETQANLNMLTLRLMVALRPGTGGAMFMHEESESMICFGLN